jgi:uncharacterized protein (TIGR02452 family)
VQDWERFTACAEENLALFAAGTYRAPSGRDVPLAAAIEASVRDTVLLRDESLAALDRLKPPPAADAARAAVACWDLRSGDAIARLLREGARRVAVLNYANGVERGGGFLHGARAQEEALCRCSTLYAALRAENPATNGFYQDNLLSDSALVRDHILVSPGVLFFRDEQLQLLELPFSATVLTAAAPDLSWLEHNIGLGKEPASRLDELPALFARRTAYVFAAARAAGCDAIVVGPWGCGAFRNDPVVVADAFAQALLRHADSFVRVVFATWGPAPNRAAFTARFGAAVP